MLVTEMSCLKLSPMPWCSKDIPMVFSTMQKLMKRSKKISVTVSWMLCTTLESRAFTQTVAGQLWQHWHFWCFTSVFESPAIRDHPFIDAQHRTIHLEQKGCKIQYLLASDGHKIHIHGNNDIIKQKWKSTVLELHLLQSKNRAFFICSSTVWQIYRMAYKYKCHFELCSLLFSEVNSVNVQIKLTLCLSYALTALVDGGY